MVLRARPLTLALVAWLCVPSICAARQSGVATVPDYSGRARAVVAALAARQFDTVFALYNATKSPALSPARIGGSWDQVIAQSGPFLRIESIQVADLKSHRATVTCVFEKGPRDIVIYLDDSGLIAGMQYAPVTSATGPAESSWTAPRYADPRTFHEEAVTIADGPWRLNATLTLPNRTSPAAAVVLVSGSGPNDGDETVGPNKVFKDLAWGLASQGIAVLRYPKRTRVYAAPSADPRTFTVKDEFVDDARAAVALLASRPDINPTRIFLAGHSEGGYLAPRIAAGDRQIAGIIILEGETRSIEQGALDQARYLATLPGADVAAVDKELSDLQSQAAAIEDPNLKAGTSVRFLTATVPASYFLDLRGYEPTTAAAHLAIPIYIGQGGRDFQVTTADFGQWQKALAHRPNVTLKLYPSLDHLLFPGVGASTPAEYLVPGLHVADDVVTDLVAWIVSR
jgi:dienelactone hydrolase